ncbi:MAG TPA: hypothetical protein VH008_27130 [Pseudonocardia sp.]|jgi:dienelactone hydrolase|nr:hypothetical protein [Pseudonocardia sp.]
MAEVLLFHHIQGLTAGVVALADHLRAAGHTVRTPDLYGGRNLARGLPPAHGAMGDRRLAGDRHLFFDSSLGSYDHAAATLLIDRVTDFLGRIERP